MAGINDSVIIFSEPCIMEPVDLNTSRYLINKEALVWRRLENETIVLDLEKATYFVLNDVASVIWESLCNGGSSWDSAKKLTQEFQIDIDTALHDTKEYIELLRSHQLLQIVS